MTVNVNTTPLFDRQSKRLFKKFPSLPQEVENLKARLRSEPSYGIEMGNGIHKIHLAIKSKGKGKSGGARVITRVEVILSEDEHYNVKMGTIYDKNEVSNISKQKILEIFKNG
jgi:hypothetical protein